MPSFCPSHAWDSYCQMQPEFLGCPVCMTESEDTWVEVPDTDPKFSELKEPLRCGHCGVYFDFAQEHLNAFIGILSEPEPDISPEDELPEDELPEEHYIAADHAYDCSKK